MFVCVECGNPLTDDVVALPEMPQRQHRNDRDHQAPATVPRGRYAIDPEPFGAPFVPSSEDAPCYRGGTLYMYDDDNPDVCLKSDGPRDTYVLHPQDADLVSICHRGSCHGMSNFPEGWNKACPCGAVVGDEISECYTHYELHLDPAKVRRRD